MYSDDSEEEELKFKLSLFGTMSTHEDSEAGTLPNILDETNIPAELKNISRHCALCLTQLTPDKVKLCGGCNRRAYCSLECQVSDWSKPWTQRHKNWCKLDCGEEDLDWKVAEVPGKGLGLIALKMIPAGSRIMVDAPRRRSHPGIQDLAPIGGTLNEKWRLNVLGGTGIEDEGDDGSDSDSDSGSDEYDSDSDSDEDDSNSDRHKGKGILCLRISRANHACLGNAAHWHDESYNVKILFAERDIQVGEEICFSYLPLNDFTNPIPADFKRTFLMTKWGIPESSCPADCFCRDPEIKKAVEECAALDKSIMRLGYTGNTVAALATVKELLEKQKVIHSSLISQTRTLYDGFSMAIARKETIDEATGFLEKLYEIKSKILSPSSEENIRIKDYMENPKSHRNYMAGYGLGGFGADDCCIC